MRRLLGQWGIVIGMMVLGLVPIVASGAPSPRIYYPKVDKTGVDAALKAQIASGKYLVKLSDCIACHTNHGNGRQGELFAGGYPIKTPFGPIYSSNITPNKVTGIGNWTFKQFDQAVRYGNSPHGFLFAAMPFNYYNNMSRSQVRDIWEYLRRVPAVDQKNKALGIPVPFSWRWLQFSWRFLFFKSVASPLKPDPQRSAEWNRGRFIVKGPGHCGACHTPHNFLGGAESRYFLQGSSISGSWAPNITSLTTGATSVQTITKVFSHARGLAGGELQVAMLDAIDHSMKFMTPADMRAVAVYLRTVTSERAPGPRPVPSNEVDLARGKQIFNTHCAACHATGAGGAPIVGNIRDWQTLRQMPLFVLYTKVWEGVSIMPPKGGCKDCSSQDLTSAIVYMIKHSQPGVGESEAQNTASKPVPVAARARSSGGEVSLAVGKQVFKESCAACHTTGAAGAPRYGNRTEWASKLKRGLPQLYKNALHGIGIMPPKGGCASCSTEQIKSAVDYLVAGSGGKAMVDSSLKSVGESEAQNTASKPAPAAARAGSSGGEVSLAVGKRVFKESCAACHTTGAAGAPRYGNRTEWASKLKRGLPQLYKNALHGIGVMPPKGGCASCSTEQIKSAVDYLVAGSGGKAMVDSSLKSVGKSKAQNTASKPVPVAARARSSGGEVSLAVGKRVFKESCAACHTTGAAGAPRYGNRTEWASKLKRGLPQLYKNALHGIGIMPPKGGCASCSTEQIKSAVDYLVAGSGGKAMVDSSLKNKKGGS